MEFVRPQHHQRVGGCSHLSQESSCRVDELTKAMWESTIITPSQFSWISPEQLLDLQASQSVHSGSNLLLVDSRDDAERAGGEIPSSVRMCGQLHDPAMPRVAAEWRRGRTVVFYCTRSLSRAPAAAHHLIRHLEAGAAGSGPPARDAAGRIERLAVLSGGICAYLQHVLIRLAACGAPGAGGAADVAAFVADFDPDMWLLAGGEQVAHVSEHPEVLAERCAARALADDGETSDELAFLVAQRCSLSPQSASSMPYIS